MNNVFIVFFYYDTEVIIKIYTLLFTHCKHFNQELSYQEELPMFSSIFLLFSISFYQSQFFQFVFICVCMCILYALFEF